MSRFDDFTRSAPKQSTEAYKVLSQWLAGGPFERTEGPFKAYLHRPDIGNEFLDINRRLREGAALPMRLRELIILITSRIWRCEFEWFAHDALALKNGLDDAVVAAMAEGARPTFKREDESAVYDFCIELDATKTVSDATFDRARAAIGDAGVLEVMTTFGLYVMIAMLINTLRVPIPAGTTTRLGDVLRRKP